MTGEETIAALPPSIRVGPFDLAINIWSPDEACERQRWGEFSSMLQRICIQSNMPTPMKAVDTFLHEVLHAMFWSYGIEDEDKEERVVGTLGTAWAQVHRDNPWLAGWIYQALNKVA